MTDRPVLRCRGISKRLGGRVVLNDVELHTERGVLTGLVGPNGAGKTTLIRILAGLLRADAGTVWLGTRALSPDWRLERRASIGVGYLAQGSTVFRGLTVWENLMSVPGAGPPACDEMAVRMGLQDHLDTAGGHLSGGERRRLEMGRLLLTRPRILICDEPFAGLDPRGVEVLAALLSDAVHSKGPVESVLLTDHRIESVFSLCDTVSVLLDGRIVASGSPAALRSDPVVQDGYLGSGASWRDPGGNPGSA